jgi:hypothetical protein
MTSETSKKIKGVVAGLIPMQQDFTIYALATGFDDQEVVRVVTSAWQNLGKAERVAKVHEAVMAHLNPSEKNRIFRFSVLTPKEWRTLQQRSVDEKSRILGFRRNQAAVKS